MGIIDLFFPKLCVGCKREGRYICNQCERGIVRMGESLRYQGVVRKALKEIKYRGTHDMVSELVAIWDPHFSDRYKDAKDQVVVCAVPMWEGKQRVRGFNQAELIARVVAKQWGVMYRELLMRTRDTKPMYGLSKSERETNVTYAFRINPKHEILNPKQTPKLKLEIRNKVIILVDDVWTTGATIQECMRVFKRAGVNKVQPLTLAR